MTRESPLLAVGNNASEGWPTLGLETAHRLGQGGNQDDQSEETVVVRHASNGTDPDESLHNRPPRVAEAHPALTQSRRIGPGLLRSTTEEPAGPEHGQPGTATASRLRAGSRGVD